MLERSTKIQESKSFLYQKISLRALHTKYMVVSAPSSVKEPKGISFPLVA